MPPHSLVSTAKAFVGLMICAAILFWICHDSSNPGHVDEWTEMSARDTFRADLKPFKGEKRSPVVKKTPDPKPPFKSGVYGSFNTDQYIDKHGSIFIPKDDVLEQMSLDEIQELYFRYVENIQIRCPRMRHIGSDKDGGYHVCEPALPNECLAYSFGNRKEYSFDDGLAAHYGCEVHAFDPGDGQPSHQHSELVSFHKIGLGGQDGVNSRKWDMKTLSSIRDMLGHSDRPIDLLKIDIEAGEWAALPQILQEGTLDHAHVKLLTIEFHMHFTKRDKAAFLHALATLQKIYDTGFRIYFFRIWFGGGLFTKYKRAFATEVHFVRI